MSTLAKTLSVFSALFMLTACGGGGSSVSRDNTDNGGSDGGTSSPTYTISLSMENASGSADKNLSQDNNLFVVATVKDQNGNPYSDALLTFTLSDPSLAEFANDTGTASTNADGVARLGLLASTASGDGEITASLSSGETGRTTFSATAIDPVSNELTVSLTLQNTNGEPDNNLTSDNGLIALATVTNSQGEPQADLLLTFSLSNDDLATFSNDTATALTDENGLATLGLVVGTASGDGEIMALLSTGESDTATFSSAGSTAVDEEPAELELYASSIQLASSGSDVIELIALVKNERSILMEGVEVTFYAANSDGVEIQLSQPVTASDGTARALVSTRNNAENRFVTVYAQVGSLSPEKVEIEIRGTEVSVNGPSSVILNNTVLYTLRVVDSDGTAIPNQTISVTPGQGEITPTTVITGADGQATITYTAIVSGVDEFLVEALGARDVINVTVQEDSFEFIDFPNVDIPLGQEITITGRWLKDNTPVVGREVLVTASRGAIEYEMEGGQTFSTNAEGEYNFNIRSSNAGLSTITASGLNETGQEEVISTLEIEFIATTPYYMQADATPDIVGPGGQTSTITAIVRDENDNLVKGQVVSFSVDDPSTGTISPSQVTTDSNGVASTVYTSGAVSSNESVVVTAQVVSTPEVQDEAILTVANRAFDISLGTGNEIVEVDSSSYLKEFAVFVSDSAGQPVSGVALTASVAPVKWSEGGGYFKGFREWTGTVWQIDEAYFCANEDRNDNGILDLAPTPDSYDEDTNKDGLLTPGIVGAVSFSSDSTTDENGQATLALRYPQNYGGWLEVVITVHGQSTGSEALTRMKFRLESSAEDLSDEAIPPPPNPFGVTAECNTTD